MVGLDPNLPRFSVKLNREAVANMCILGNISYQLGRSLEWDPVTERCVGDSEANRMLGNPQRQPWRL